MPNDEKPGKRVHCCCCHEWFIEDPDKPAERLCSRCGAKPLLRLYICTDCFELLKSKAPMVQPYKCPLCNGKGCARCDDGILWR